MVFFIIIILYDFNDIKKLYGINKKYSTLYSKDEPLLNVYFLILTMKDILDELNMLWFYKKIFYLYKSKNTI